MFTRLSPASIAEQLAHRSRISPEFWLLNPPASLKDIKRLEAKLGWLVPDPLAQTLLRFNGGFASCDGKVGIDSGEEISTARDKANRFLNCGEIDAAYQTLLGSHPDEDASCFPFIPFMRLADGGLVVVNAMDPIGACWNAWTLDGPHRWPRLYPSFAGLLRDYLVRDGVVLSKSHADEPTALAEAY